MLKTCLPNSQKLPLTALADEKNRSFQALQEITVANKDFFHDALQSVGALLLRGFEVRSADDFLSFVRQFAGKELFNYAGGASPRSALRKNVYNSTEYPPNLTLELHNELSYSKIFPRHLYFFCQKAPEKGGETSLGDSRRILRKIRPSIADLFKQKQVLYERHLKPNTSDGYSWREAFETDDKSTVEDICRRVGAEFEWQAEDCLRIRQIRPATAVHPETGEEVWFNQAHGFHASALAAETLAWYQARHEKPRLNSCFGDNSPICALTLGHIREVLQAETVPHRWQASDILILDNILTAHGRMPFSGARKIILAMT